MSTCLAANAWIAKNARNSSSSLISLSLSCKVQGPRAVISLHTALYPVSKASWVILQGVDCLEQ